VLIVCAQASIASSETAGDDRAAGELLASVLEVQSAEHKARALFRHPRE